MANNNLVYLPSKLDRDAIFSCKLTIDSRYKETSEKIDNYLNNQERAMFFQNSPFGNLVRYHRDFHLSSQIIWYLMSRQIVDNGSDEFWMVVGKRPIRFSMLDYCLLTGLDCAIEPDLPEEEGAFVSTHFVDKSEILLSDLEAKIIVHGQNLTEGVDVEKLKMASLYFCCAVFCEGTRRKSTKIDPRFIRLIDDLDRFNRYPWGRIAYVAAVRGLRKDLLGRYTYLMEAQGRKEVDGSFLLGGFVLPLQILAYEYYPSVAQKFAKKRDAVDGLLLPRMFQWVTNTWSPNRAPSAVEVSKAFGACATAECVGRLTPTPEELVAPYYMTGVFVDSAPDAVITRVLELWSQGQNVLCSQHPVDNEVESPPVRHASSSLDGSGASSSSHPDGSSTPSADGTRSSSSIRSPIHSTSADGTRSSSSTRSPIHSTRSSSSTRSPIHTGPRLHFGRNPARSPSSFGERLTSLEDSVKSLQVEVRAGFIETRACIRDMNLGFDLLRSSLAEQIRAGLDEIRSQTLSEIRSQTPVRDPIDSSRKRKSSVLEADVGVDETMVGELFGSSSQAEEATPSTSPVVSIPVFQPNLSTIPEESSEKTQLNADAGFSSGETTTSRADVVRPFVDSVTFKVNNSLARVRAAMLVHSPGMVKGFYDNYEKSFYGPMAIANSHVLLSHMTEALRGLLEMQLRHAEVMSPVVSLMDSQFYVSLSVVGDENRVLTTNLLATVKGIHPEWPCISWEKTKIILIPVYTDGQWFLLKLVPEVNKCTIFDLQRRHDPNCKALNEHIEPILINAARLLSIVGNNPHPDRPWRIQMPDNFKDKIKDEDAGAFVLTVAGYALANSDQLILHLDDRLVSEFRYFLACNMFDNLWTFY